MKIDYICYCRRGWKLKIKKIGASVILALSIGLSVLALDLITKYVLESFLPLGSVTTFLPGFINLIIVHNDGAAWNAFAGKQVFLILLTVLIISIFLAYYITKVIKSKKPISKTLGAAVGLIAGGCFGNLYDRIFLGYVRDFLNFEFMDFPVFNVADMALTFGIITLIVYFIFIYPKEEKQPTLAESKSTNSVEAWTQKPKQECQDLQNEKEFNKEDDLVDDNMHAEPGSSSSEAETDGLQKTNDTADKQKSKSDIDKNDKS